MKAEIKTNLKVSRGQSRSNHASPIDISTQARKKNALNASIGIIISHPPFAPDVPFSPSRVERQMTPAKVVGTEPTGVRGNPKAMTIAERLRDLLAKP